MSSFYRLLFLEAVPTELLGHVIVPDLVQRDIESLCDDLEEIEGGEEALRWICNENECAGNGKIGTISNGND